MRILPLTLILMALPVPAFAQMQDSTGGQTPSRVRSVTLTPGQDCPKAQGDEIVVCRPAEEPYRIPKGLRDTGPVAVPNSAWGARVADLEQASRVNGGIPNTCSPVGNGGQTGCAVQALRNWSAERRAQQRAEESVP